MRLYALYIQINASQVMFWEQTMDKLELMHVERIYPPKVTLTLELMESCSSKSVSVHIHALGAQNELDMEVMLPLGLLIHQYYDSGDQL